MELRDYLVVLSARRWIIIQATVAAAVVALVGSLVRSPVYEAQSVLLVKERNTPNSVLGEMLPGLSLQPERAVQTHVRLLQMPGIADRAAQSLRDRGEFDSLDRAPGDAFATPAGARSPAGSPEGYRLTGEEIQSKIAVEVDPQTNLIYVTVRDGDAKRASAIADAVAVQYARSNQVLNTAEIENARREITYRLLDVQEDILALGRVVSGKRGAGKTVKGGAAKSYGRRRVSPAVKKTAAARLKMAMGVYQMLTSKEQELRISESMEPGEAIVVQRSKVPTAPVEPKPLRNLFLGLVLGALLGTGTAFLADYVDNTIKIPEDVDRYFHLPLLGQIPANEEPEGGSEPGKKASPPIVVTADSKSTAAEAYRALRTSLSYLNYDGAVKTILVTSSRPREGKTSVVLNLSMALAHAGHRVLMIDADLRKPRLHRSLGLSNSPGLTNILAGKISLEEAVQRTSQEGLHVITSGPTPPNPSELLSSAHMDDLLVQCAHAADFVIVDSPPALAVTDCAVLAPKVDGVLVAAAAGETTREEAKRVVDVLSGEHVRLLGVVLDKVPLHPRYGYHYYYYYSYRYKPYEYQLDDAA